MGLFANMINDFELFILTEGEYVFRVGETSEEIFFIVDGEIAITTGENKELVRLKKNDFFGEMSVLDDSTTVRSVFFFIINLYLIFTKEKCNCKNKCDISNMAFTSYKRSLEKVPNS